MSKRRLALAALLAFSGCSDPANTLAKAAAQYNQYVTYECAGEVRQWDATWTYQGVTAFWQFQTVEGEVVSLYPQDGCSVTLAPHLAGAADE